MGFPNDRSNDPKAPITWGRDFNFFQNATITASTFATDADMVITFPSYTVTFVLTGGGKLQYSFNGNTVHGDMDSAVGSLTASLTFQNRQVTKIWFKNTSGTTSIRVEAWGIR